MRPGLLKHDLSGALGLEPIGMARRVAPTSASPYRPCRVGAAGSVLLMEVS